MYLDWETGADETITMSDFLVECFKAGVEPKEIYEKVKEN